MYKSVLESIGNTPLVEIRKLNPSKTVKIYAKLEYFNPGGSVKDRIALYMVNEAEKRGSYLVIRSSWRRRAVIQESALLSLLRPKGTDYVWLCLNLPVRRERESLKQWEPSYT